MTDFARLASLLCSLKCNLQLSLTPVLPAVARRVEPITPMVSVHHVVVLTPGPARGFRRDCDGPTAHSDRPRSAIDLFPQERIRDVQEFDHPSLPSRVVLAKGNTKDWLPVRREGMNLVGDRSSIEDVTPDPSKRNLHNLPVSRRHLCLSLPRSDEEGKHLQFFRRVFVSL